MKNAIAMFISVAVLSGCSTKDESNPVAVPAPVSVRQEPEPQAKPTDADFAAEAVAAQVAKQEEAERIKREAAEQITRQQEAERLAQEKRERESAPVNPPLASAPARSPQMPPRRPSGIQWRCERCGANGTKTQATSRDLCPACGARLASPVSFGGSSSGSATVSEAGPVCQDTGYFAGPNCPNVARGSVDVRSPKYKRCPVH